MFKTVVTSSIVIDTVFKPTYEKANLSPSLALIEYFPLLSDLTETLEFVLTTWALDNRTEP